MQIQIHTQGFDLTPAIQRHVLKQIHFQMANFESHIVSMDVFLRDINGPKGGPDKKVSIRVDLSGRKTVMVEQTRSDLYAATIVASRQASRAVRRSLGKHRRMEKLALRELRQFSQI